ncbi:MAG: tetratricopeptide repeat protein, partial [Rhodothermia bacterium]|nr:tetratricopeptide repeat protein [Rhodothermia bacterium]
MLTSEYSRAISLLDSGDAQEAAYILTRIVEKYPRYAAAQIALAKAVSQTGEAKEAFLQWSRAEALLHGSDSVRSGLRLAADRVFAESAAPASHPGPQAGTHSEDIASEAVRDIGPGDVEETPVVDEADASPSSHPGVRAGTHSEETDGDQEQEGPPSSGPDEIVGVDADIEPNLDLQHVAGVAAELDSAPELEEAPGLLEAPEFGDSPGLEEAPEFGDSPSLEEAPEFVEEPEWEDGATTSHPGHRSGIHPTSTAAPEAVDPLDQSTPIDLGAHEKEPPSAGEQPEWQESGATESRVRDVGEELPEWEAASADSGDGSDADFDINLDAAGDDVELDRLIDELETARIVPRPDLDT